MAGVAGGVMAIHRLLLISGVSFGNYFNGHQILVFVQDDKRPEYSYFLPTHYTLILMTLKVMLCTQSPTFCQGHTLLYVGSSVVQDIMHFMSVAPELHIKTVPRLTNGAAIMWLIWLLDTSQTPIVLIP
ncbi:hypothetical protein LINGRAHAP2_LOCUS9227 [Linum grandiflorum]